MNGEKSMNSPVEILNLCYKFFRDYVFRVSTLITIFISLVLSIFYLSTLSPKFLISTEVLLANEQNGGTSSGRGELSNLLSMGQSSTPSDKFILNAFSASNAKYLWDKGYAKEFFSSLYDPDTGTFKSKRVGFLDKLSASVIGYDINTNISIYDLQSLIRSEIKVISEEPNLSISISMKLSDPDLGKRFLNDFVMGADLVAKNTSLLEGEARVASLLNELQSSDHPQVIRDGLVNLINSNLFKMTSAKAETPLSITFVQDIVSSQNPVYPKPFFIMLSFSLLGVLLVFFITFMLKNRDDIFS